MGVCGTVFDAPALPEVDVSCCGEGGAARHEPGVRRDHQDDAPGVQQPREAVQELGRLGEAAPFGGGKGERKTAVKAPAAACSLPRGACLPGECGGPAAPGREGPE